MKRSKKAFTLVEVLITIGIIGVVAAITIPTLLQNTNNHKFATRFKKAVSTLAQASLTSQAQYDMDYSSLSQDSNDTTCATDAIAKGNSTMCGLFNNTLAGHSYQGVYGTVKGANLSDPYTISYTTTGFNPEGNLIYALADGTLVGFKPGAKNCRLKPGNVLSADVITSSEGLANCVGFIDVNGVQTPNKEVTCSSGTSEFSTTPCFIKSSGNAISDVFPIVFHDGTVEPATNAARAVMARGKSSVGDNTEDTTSTETPTTPAAPTTTEHGYTIGVRNDPTTWEPFTVSKPMSHADCEAQKASLGIQYCRDDNNDYWAAAVEECGGVQNMLTDDDLTALAQTLYPDCSGIMNGAPYCISTLDTSKIPDNLSGLGFDWNYLWSGSENSDPKAYRRSFWSTTSARGYNNRTDSSMRAVCVQSATN